MDKRDVEAFVKRLETIQNMTDTVGVKEVCEVLMEILEKQVQGELGFKTERMTNEETSN